MKNLKLAELHPHPRNPRLTIDQEIVDQIAAQISGRGGVFDAAHALIVRPNAAGYEILSGHQRARAAAQAGLNEVPCWIRPMPDAEAYMMLVLDNAQSPLSPLEEGLHALGSGLSQRAYAKKVGKKPGTMQDRVEAAKVAKVCRDIPTVSLAPYWSALSEIHAAPEWLWQAVVGKMLDDKGWTVEAARKAIVQLKDMPEPPKWVDAEVVAGAVVKGEIKRQALAAFQSTVDKTVTALERNADEDPLWSGQSCTGVGITCLEFLYQELEGAAKLSDVQEICKRHLDRQASDIAEVRAAELAETRKQEADAARLLRLHENVSLEEWKTLDADQQEQLLNDPPVKTGGFNKQESAAIEWAQFSWNPVTGCEHDCPYCYARDIAINPKTASAFPNGFAPTLRPNSLFKPRGLTPPGEAATDTRFRNVFTCSMADLFGRWVPRPWIEAVLREVRAAPNWNFLFLTKFPKRMAEFEIPSNAWMGTTVDLQARVSNAEAAFSKVKSGVRWLSVEPMLEPLRFQHLDLFNWIVIGGCTASTETPKFIPPIEWVVNLIMQARDAGLKIYMKTNLGVENRLIELPFDAPIKDLFEHGQIAPEVLQYLKRRKAEAVE